MAKTPEPIVSNAERGLEKHVNPEDPTGPMLNSLGDLPDHKPAKSPKPDKK